VPSLSRNLVSLSKLDVTGYSFNFGNGCFSLFRHNHLIGTGVLCDGLYKLDGLYAETVLTLHHNVSTKHNLVNERSAILWHKCLGHISRERMKRLIKNEIFPDLNLNICVDCIKEKQTKHSKKGATRNILHHLY